MAIFNCEGLFDFLTPEKKDFLNSKFQLTGAQVMPHELSGPLNISRAKAIAILTALQAAKASKTYIAVYHYCEPDHVVAYLPFENGFPSIPWNCENCQEEVNDISELSFSLMAISNQPIHFI